MKKGIITICLSLLLVGLVAGLTYAYTAEVSYFFDGLDIDTGEVYRDPSILVVLSKSSTEIDEILKPNTDTLFNSDLYSTVDLCFEYNPFVENAISILPEYAMQVAIADDSFDFTQSENLGTLDFQELSANELMTLDINDILFIKTAFSSDMFMLKITQQDSFDAPLMIEVNKVVPEPSTLVLFVLGILGLMGLLKRNKMLKCFLLIFPLLLVGTTHLALGEENIFIQKSGDGDGTIIVGEDECGVGCPGIGVKTEGTEALVLKAIPDMYSQFMGWKTPNTEGTELLSLDGVFQAQTDLNSVVAEFKKNSLQSVDNIIRSDGGTVHLSDSSASVIFPKGVTSQDLTVSITEIAKDSHPPYTDGEPELVGKVYDFTAKNDLGEPVTFFYGNIEIAIKYDPSQVSAEDEQNIKIHYYDEGNEQWITLPSTIDTQNHIVKATTNHFSYYSTRYCSSGIAEITDINLGGVNLDSYCKRKRTNQNGQTYWYDGVTLVSPYDAGSWKCKGLHLITTIFWIFTDVHYNQWATEGIDMNKACREQKHPNAWAYANPNNWSDSGAWKCYRRISRCVSSPYIATPTVTGVSPNPLKPLPVSQRQWITIYGKNFTRSSRLEFQIVGGYRYSNRVPVYVNSTQLKYYISVGTNIQDWTVKVINGGKISNAYRFSVRNQTQETKPVITSVSPNPVPRKTDWSKQWLTVYGKNFVPGSKLLFKITGTQYVYPDRVPTYVSSTQLKYYISVGPNIYNWTVEVISPNGQRSNAYGFQVR